MKRVLISLLCITMLALRGAAPATGDDAAMTLAKDVVKASGGSAQGSGGKPGAPLPSKPEPTPVPARPQFGLT